MALSRAEHQLLRAMAQVLVLLVATTHPFTELLTPLRAALKAVDEEPPV